MDRHIALIMLRRVPVALLLAAALFSVACWVFGAHWVLAAAFGLFVFGSTLLYGPQRAEPDTSLSSLTSRSSSSSSSDSGDSGSD
jgi:hypothetical protein